MKRTPEQSAEVLAWLTMLEHCEAQLRRHFIRVGFGERRFAAPFANGRLEPWDHEPTLAEVVGEVAALVEMLEGEEP